MRMPLPACDASLGSMSVSPAWVAWHGTVQLAQHGLAGPLTAHFGTALLLISFRTCSLHLEPLHSPISVSVGASGTQPLFYTSCNRHPPLSAAPSCCLHPPKLPGDVPWCRAEPVAADPSALGAGSLENQELLATWCRQPRGAGGSVLTATSLLPAPGL